MDRQVEAFPELRPTGPHSIRAGEGQTVEIGRVGRGPGDGLDPEHPLGKSLSAERVVVAAAIGGTTSALTGGNFANGAITGAFSRAFNDEHKIELQNKSGTINADITNKTESKDPAFQLRKDLSLVRSMIASYNSDDVNRFDSDSIILDISPKNYLDPTIAQGDFNTQSITIIYARYTSLSDTDRYDTLLHEFRHTFPENYDLRTPADFVTQDTPSENDARNYASAVIKKYYGH